jgi:hypothetical protein
MKIVNLKAEQLKAAALALDQAMRLPRMDTAEQHMYVLALAVAPHVQFELEEFSKAEIDWAAQGIDAERGELSMFAMRLVAIRRDPMKEDPRVPVLTAVVNAIGTGVLGKEVEPQVIAQTLVAALQKAGL